MFRMTPHGHRLSNGGLTDSQLPLDVPGGSLNLGYLRRVPVGHNPHTRFNPATVPTAKKMTFSGPQTAYDSLKSSSNPSTGAYMCIRT